MKDIKNFLIKREQSQACLSFAKREKSRLLAKTILTLVALLALTTGAWAQEETPLTTITPTAKEQASYSTANVATVSFSYTANGSSGYLANWGWWGYGWIATVTAAEGYTITKCIFYDDADRTATDSEAPFVVETTEEDKTPRINGTPIDGGNMWSKGIKTIEVYGYVTPAAPSGPKVAWDKAEKTGTFTMPGGNVTLEPEYYPQAALAAAPTAINDVPATTDGAIVKAGTVKSIGETATAQGTVMYYVSPSALDDAALLALAADQWTADVPTAKSLAEGQAHVYYYVRGNDSDTDDETFSDGDILAANALTVTIAAEPTYAVTFAEGTDANEWTASPATDVKKGTEVTVTYTGSKKVIGVKAEKKASAKTLSEATLEDIGKIAGADGNIYDTKAAAEAVATGNAVAMIAYVGSASDCTHGLAIALADESGTKTWSEAGAACSGKTAVTGGTWRLPSIKDWQYMFIGCGASGSYSDSPSTMSYSELATKLTTANGTALQTLSYWSSTESSPGEDAWSLYFGGSSASFFSGDYEGGAYPIRACLAF